LGQWGEVEVKMVVLVTGCRSGFGKLIAVEAARRGHTVFAGLRDLSTAGDLRALAQGLAVTPVQLDVVRPEQREAVVRRILAEHGCIDALVNNAGVALGGFLEQIDEDELRDVFDVNVFAPWALTKLVLPSMRERRAGRIVNISSMSGFMAFPGLGAYSGSKFALEGLSESWRHELNLMGIDLYLVQPGAYATDIWGRNKTLCRHGLDDDSPWRAYAERMLRSFDQEVSKRVRPPGEVADLVCDLLDGPRRRMRHAIGPATLQRLIVKRYLPFSVVERAVKRVFLSRDR